MQDGHDLITIIRVHEPIKRKIAMLMATRGNPKAAEAVIRGAEMLKSGRHEIIYILGVDEDDTETIKHLGDSELPIMWSIAPRTPSLGEIFNRCAAAGLEHGADIFSQLSDDTVIATGGWDDIIASAISSMKPSEIAVAAWNDSANIGQCTHPVFSKEWLKIGGYYTNYFPFWFDDTWLSELWSFITGRTIPFIPGANVVGVKSQTRRMRDLAFWWDFYSKMRETRLSIAAGVRKKLGIKLSDEIVGKAVEMWEERDRKLKPLIPQMERMANAGDSAPTKAYLDIKARAEGLISREADAAQS